MIGFGEVWIKVNRPLRLLFRGLPVPEKEEIHAGHGVVRYRGGVIQLQSFLRRRLRLGEGVFGRENFPERSGGGAMREAAISGCVMGLELNRLLEGFKCSLVIVREPVVSPP